MGEGLHVYRRHAVGMIKISITATGLYAFSLLLSAPAAHAQTADQYNRASQAIQICSSPMGATIPECAKLRGMYGAPTLGAQPSAIGLGALGGFKGMGSAGNAAGIASLLGSAMSAARSTTPTQPATPAGNGAMIQQAITDCVRNAAGNSAMIQGCLAIATGGTVPSAR